VQTRSPTENPVTPAQCLDLSNAFEAKNNWRIADDHRMRDTGSMIGISEIYANGDAAKTYLPVPGGPDVDLLPHEVVGCAFLVNDSRHSHDAFLVSLNRVATFRTPRASRWGESYAAFLL
jgi:hypothetical protein